MLNTFKTEKQVDQLDDTTNAEPTTAARKTFVEAIHFIDFMCGSHGVEVVLPDGTEARLITHNGKVYIELP